MYLEYGCIAKFWKNETATMFFLKKPSIVNLLFIVAVYQPQL